MEFHILGPLEVWSDGQPLRLGGARQRALLAALLLERGRAVTAERLIEMLWGAEPPDTAHNVLQVYISQLRKLLEPGRQREEPPRILVGSSAGYMLTVEPEQLDVTRFERLVNVARQALSRGEPRDAARLFREALALWRGSALANVEEAFAHAERTRLEELRLGALEDRIEADLALGAHIEVIAELQSLALQHPLRERLCGQLMLALYRSGRQAESSAVFHRTRQMLDEELGMEPGAALQKLFGDILNQQLSPQPIGDIPQGPQRRPSLPLQLTRFIGREEEISALQRLVGSGRLVTLTGPGGVGKTRLALEVATTFRHAYADRVHLVELGSLADSDFLPHSISAALRIQEQARRDMLETLIDALADQSVLIVLDNCEHLIDASAQVVGQILQFCPNVRVLATSREPLRVAGESVWPVRPLPIAPVVRRVGADELLLYDGPRLFTERAASAQSGFMVTDGNAPAIAVLCQKLDGIPLALELAAACLPALSVQQLAEGALRQFKYTVEGSRTAPPRQRTLQRAIDWSYELLSEQERILFGRLSVFAGGWTLEAAERVCSDERVSSEQVVSVLLALVNKSLVSVDMGGAGESTHQRYRFLETLREYASERLRASGELEAIQREHATYLLDIAEGSEDKARGSDVRAWSAMMEAEHDNLRAALDWSLIAAPDVCLRLTTAWEPFWEVRGYFAEGRHWQNRALAASAAATQDRARALALASDLTFRQGDFLTSRALGEGSLMLAEQLGDLPTIARVLNRIATTMAVMGDRVGAQPLYDRSIALYQQLGDSRGALVALSNIGKSHAYEGDHNAARELFERILPATRETGDLLLVGIALEELGSLYLRASEFAAAHHCFSESLAIWRERESPVQIALSLACFAHLAAATSQPERSIRLAGASETCLDQAGVTHASLADWWTAEAARAVEDMRRRIGSSAANIAWEEGRAMSREDAVRYALLDNIMAALHQR